MEREVVKMMHYGWSSGEMEWTSGVGVGGGTNICMKGQPIDFHHI